MRTLAVCLLLFSTKAAAEYRAFELVISDPTSGQERVVLSTLDPIQYRYYYPVRPEESVTYSATWRCRGNTSGQPICPKPEDKAPAQLDRR
jgi:hypothetical protein